MTNRKPSLLRRSFRALGRLTLTMIVIAAAAGTLVAGRGVLADRAAARPAPDAAPATPVTVSQIHMQDSHEVIRRFSGQVEARQQTDLAFERSGTIAEILVREGDSVTEGQPIARLDIRLLQAERMRLEASREAMVAQIELARRTNERQAELRERGFATDQRVDDTSLTLTRLQSEIAGIDASLMTVDVNLSKSELVAPFDGTIGTRALDAGAVASPGIPVVSLLQDGAPRFRAGLDPALAADLTIGQTVIIRMSDVDQTSVLAQLTPDLDPVTRSRIAFFDIEGEAPPPGATGEVLLIQTIDKPGAWVPLSALRQGPRGTWLLMTVEDGTVGTEAAEILHLDSDRAFIRGTFTDGQSYLPGGTHRVVPGQPVTVSEQIAWAR
ncbi:MAG: efflux RND transporter periplasmic adaptor subunit [Pseudomonadota bacterium]